MVQLTKDDVHGKLMSIDDVLAKIRADIKPLAQSETVSLLKALNRYSAEDILAPLSLPSFLNSAVDGYAVNFSDIIIGKLAIKNRVIAGDNLQNHEPKTATRIFTGAPMPIGADTVFMQEDVTIENDHVILPQGLKRGANARPVGEDIMEGAIAVTKNTKITPRQIALLAALGISKIFVKTQIKIAVFSTGNEIVNPLSKLVSGKIYDANRFLLMSLITEAGAEPIDLGILPDNQEIITEKLLQASKTSDIIITSGGVSMGEEDYVKAAIASIGTLNFWKVGIKPGRPVLMGDIDKAKIIGLPGNPVAVFVTFNSFVKAMIAALMGVDYIKPMKQLVTLGFDYKKKEGRKEYVRVKLNNGIAEKYPQDGAGVITSLTKTDGLLELNEEKTHLKQGELVDFIKYENL